MEETDPTRLDFKGHNNAQKRAARKERELGDNGRH